MTERLGYADIEAAAIPDWRMLLTGIHAHFVTGDFATGLRLVDAIGAAAEEAGHHPDLTLTYGAVDVRLLSHDLGQVTGRDVELARRISAIAAEQGVAADPAGLQQLELGLDTPDRSAVQPFWAALLDYRPSGEDAGAVVDPRGQSPSVWFQESGSEEPRQRWHLDVWVPGDQVEARLAAVRDAGGAVVARFPEHSFWVVQDAEGNRSCVCTRQGR